MLVTIVSLLISVLVAVFLYHRSRPAISKGRALSLTALRAVTLFIALMLLLSPVYSFLRTRKLKPEVILLMDNSKSMETGGKSAFMKQQAKQLEGKYRQAGYRVVKHNFAAGLNGDKSDTRLTPTLQELSASHDLSQVQSIVLLSDGWLKDEDLGQIKQLGLPISTIADSSKFVEIDLEVSSLRNNRHAYRGEPALFKAEVMSRNYSGPAQVQLLLKDKVLLSKDIVLKADEAQSVEFNHTFQTLGFQNLQVRIQAAGVKEKSLGNNSYPTAVEVLADKEHIYLITDKIAWDNKFISDVILANSRWQSTSYTLQNGVIKQGERQVNAFGSKLPAVLVVINNGELKADSKLVDLVRRAHAAGSGILWQGMPLAELSSVLALSPSNVSGNYQGFLKLTSQNQAYPLINIESGELKNIPPLDFYYLKASADAQILATIDQQAQPPAIALRAAAGKVINIGFLNLWRWQLQSPGSSYKDIVTNMLTWLGKGSASSFRAIYENSYFQNEQFTISLRAEDAIKEVRADLSPTLKIKDEDGKEVYSDFMTHSEEDYQATLSLGKAGNYSFEISDPAAKEKIAGSFNVAKGSLEERDLHYNLPLLQWLASESGARVLNQSEVEKLSPPQAQEIKETSMFELPLYRKWYVLTLFLLAFGVELFFRRRWGML